VGVLIVSAAHRVQPRVFLFAGSILLAIAILILGGADTRTVFFLACATAGLGFGLVESSASILARWLAARETPAALAGLNGAAAVCAAACPILISVASSLGSPATGLVVLALLPVANAVLAGRAWRGEAPAGREHIGDTISHRPSRAAIGMLPIALALFLFVGVETVFSGWSSVLPLDLLKLDPQEAALGTSAFWILMAAGRYLAAAIIKRGVGPLPYLAVTQAAGSVVLAIAAVLGVGSAAAELVVAGVAVLLLAPGYALVLGLALRAVSDGAARRVTGVLVAIGAAGGSAIPFVFALAAGTRMPLLLGLAAVTLLGSLAFTILHAVLAHRIGIRAAAGV
jgi:hypothetical protein